MKKLISMVEYVNGITTKPLGGQQVASVRHVELEKYRMIFKYSQFLQQIPILGMFVPCDDLGNVLEIGKNTCQYDFEVEKQAEQRVIFEGWELNQKDISKLENIICITKNKTQLTFFKLGNSIFLDNLITNQTFEIKTIEDLVPYNLIMK